MDARADTEPMSQFLVSSSTVSLPSDSILRRRPRWGWKERDPRFGQNFEDRALFYDCFSGPQAGEVLLVGPPPLNLAPHYRAARFRALPQGTTLRPQYFISLSTAITRLRGVPPGAKAIEIVFGAHRFEAEIAPSLVERFAGRRVLFTMSKDNSLEWIAAWAQYYARRHATDAVVVFDNGSTAYAPDRISQVLSAVPGIADHAVLSWPQAYGAIDRAVIFNPYWAQFLQVSSMSVLLRRLAQRAKGIINADIDELIETPEGADIYGLATESSHGLVSMEGQWVEPVPRPESEAPLLHSDFGLLLRDEKQRRCSARKWVLDPQREWVSDLGVHPYMHWIERRPPGSKAQPPGSFFWHFKGINTNWKTDRARIGKPDDASMTADALLAKCARHIDKDAAKAAARAGIEDQ